MSGGERSLPCNAFSAYPVLDRCLSIRIKADFTMSGKEGAADIKATSRILAELESLQSEVPAEGKETGLAYKCLPHVDQQACFGSVYKSFHEGEIVGIFPEGKPCIMSQCALE